MASSNAVRYLADGTAADDGLELALELAWGTLYEQYYNKRVFWDQGPMPVYAFKRVTSGKSWQFETLADGPGAEEHDSGQEMLGQNYAVKEANITVDKPLVTHKDIGFFDNLVAHWDQINPLIRQNGRKIAEKLDIRVAVTGVLSARTAQITKNGFVVHNGGNVVTASTSGDIAVAYPVTVAGAKAFRDDANQLARLMDEDNVPPDGRFLFISPLIAQILQQDTTVFDRDLTGLPGDIATRALGMLAGFILIKTNVLPYEDTSLTTSAQYDVNSKYQSDFSVGGATGRPAALALCGASEGSAGIGLVESSGLAAHMSFDDRRDTYFTKARIVTGMGVLNPWCAGEIRVTS